jgi:hypothetical protein
LGSSRSSSGACGISRRFGLFCRRRCGRCFECCSMLLSGTLK